MNDELPAPTTTGNPNDAAAAERLPFSKRQVVLSQAEFIQLKWDANYWKAQHERSCAREEKLKQQLVRKAAQIRELKQRLFGKKSEKGVVCRDQVDPEPEVEKRPRGQQKGSVGHGRTQRPHLARQEEVWDFAEERCWCTQCGLPYDDFPGTEDSEIFEIEVRAYKRLVKRKRYKKGCSCLSTRTTPALITVPPAPKLIPRSPYGISIWEQVLLSKFLHGQPLHGILQGLKGLGLPIAQGTVTGGLRKLSTLFEPIHRALYLRQMEEKLFHNDESRWEVYEAVEGKVGHRWYLWVIRSPSVIYYCMDPRRSAAVPMGHFGGLESEQVIVVCDRYSAYKKLARLDERIVLAFCWAHVRRDFLDLARGFPELKGWALDWVAAIGRGYCLNRKRLEQWDCKGPLPSQGLGFQEAHASLQEHLQQMKARCNALLQADQPAGRTDIGQAAKADQPLHSAQRKVLRSLNKHWQGLTVFVDHPQVPMDNNAAERAIRNPVIGRKSYYGSGSIWSAQLAVMLFSLFQTLGLWNINSRHWLRDYLETCAEKGGQAPTRLTPFLPWKMTAKRQRQLSRPLDVTDTS